LGENKCIRLIVTGGGTGGHLFPGIAVAESVLAGYPESKVMFVGTNRLIDTRALAARKFQTATIVSHGLKGKSVVSRLRTLVELPWSLFAAARIVKRFKPDVVLGVGGYVTGPVVLAAKLLGAATCIHEQNSIPGLANRMLGKFVDRIFISIPGSEKYFPAERTFFTGNPVRNELLQTLGKKKESNTEKVTLVVLGGSQGAHRVNELITGMVAKHTKEFQEDIELIHQTGSHDEDWVIETYKKLKVKAKVKAFFDTMSEVYQQADLLVSRAGATTLAEVTALHKPVVLIPYPFAADDHQAHNGRYLVEGGAALMFREDELVEEKFNQEVMGLLKDKERREKMSAAAGRLAKPEATQTIVANCFQMAGCH
jgi:UDP-N-acetylglucosamine--N-acetylmuramyl-(pentapeptide) pyrophosphoryl-undecaprenol N-acetylglucosamine transferase